MTSWKTEDRRQETENRRRKKVDSRHGYSRTQQPATSNQQPATNLTNLLIFLTFEQMQQLIHWLETHQLSCFYKHYLGVACPGCGMQTALILLLKGQLLESIIAYPALLPTIFMICFLILHLSYNLKKGALILKISFIFTVVIMVLNFIIKLTTI